MTKHRICCLPGDGVGKIVMDATMVVLEQIKLDAEYSFGDIGWEFWRKEGNPLPDRTLKLVENADCCLFGAETSKPDEDTYNELDPKLQGKGYHYYSPILRLRQEFDLHTNVRPFKSFQGHPLNSRDDIDLVLFRENSEGMYSGVEYYPLPAELRAILSKHPGMKRFAQVPSEDMAVGCRIITRTGARRIIRHAFEHARKFGRKTVTLVEKPNVLRETGGMMLREARNIAVEYPGIVLKEMNVDAMCMRLVTDPQNYEVLVASNLFGDIVSDLCAALVGGLGVAPSGNIGDRFAIFEPIHGSAPDYPHPPNPIAMLLSAKMMLDFLGETEQAGRLETAVAGVIKEGKVRTFDMGGSATTLEMAQEVARHLA